MQAYHERQTEMKSEARDAAFKGRRAPNVADGNYNAESEE